LDRPLRKRKNLSASIVAETVIQIPRAVLASGHGIQRREGRHASHDNNSGHGGSKALPNGTLCSDERELAEVFLSSTCGLVPRELVFFGDESLCSKSRGRVFNVKLQGDTTFQNLDIFAAVGANTALVKGANILATDGAVTIELDSITQVAVIDAIEITQSVEMPQLNLSFVYADGTPVAGTLNYNVTSGSAGGQA